MFRIKYRSEKGNYASTLRPIFNNEIIAVFGGVPIDFNETLRLGDRESFALQVGLNRYIYLDAPYRFFNHSCEPNCGLTPGLELIAIRDIEQGEELSYDYSTTMLEQHWEMKCNCGASRCRKRITDFNLLPHDIRKFYLDRNLVQSFILHALKVG